MGTPRRARDVIGWRDGCLIAVVALLLVPVALDRDDFPLSIYPMYARERSESVALVTANGITADGSRVRLSLDVIGASDDPLIVAGELRAAVRRGDEASACDRIARRIDQSSGVTTIEVVTERHDVVRRTAGDASLLDRNVHTTCPVPEPHDA